MADIRHARPQEHLVDGCVLARRQRPRVVGVIRGAQDGLLDVVEVNFNGLEIHRVLVRLHQHGLREPLLHAGDAALQRPHVAVAFGDHPLEHGHVGHEVLDDRLLVELNRASRRRPLRGGVGKLKGLLALELREALNLQDAAGEDIFLAGLLNSQKAALQRRVRNGVDEVAQRDARLHGAREAHEDGFRHVQGHDACRRRECDEARPRREGDANGEARVRVAARAHRVGQEHAVEPRVDDAIAGPERDSAARADEVRQRRVRHHVDGLGVRGRVAERLHDEVGGEAEAGQVLEFVARHRPRRVLRADGSHQRLAVRARRHAAHAAGLAHHLLAQRVTLELANGDGRAERVRRRQPEHGARLGRQRAADDQGDAAAGADLVEEDLRLELERGEDCRLVAVLGGDTIKGKNINHVAHVHRRDVHLDR
mmetsp:Transcript_11714/g.41380  ORF Transcript_11714/g.41380 Transcript_11714/m.41380 type:complete len:425 (-) Transcript_11714:957-2231(-)